MRLLKIAMIFGIVSLCSNTSFSQVADCDRQGKQDSVQKVKEAVYEAINQAKIASIPQDKLKKLKDDYANLSKEFNKVFKTMSGELGLLNKRKKVCEKYSSKLQPLVTKASSYIKEVQAAASIKAGNAGGGDWMNDIIDAIAFIITGYDKIVAKRKELFYNSVAWADTWDEVPAS